MNGSISEDSVFRVTGDWQSGVSRFVRSVTSLSEGVQSSRRSDESSSVFASSETVEILSAGDAGVSQGELPEDCRAIQLAHLYYKVRI